MKQKKGLIVPVSLAVVVFILLLGIGGKRYMDRKKTDTNFENQRKAALALRKEEPHMTKIEFTSEGSRPGIGIPWTVGAKVTMDDEVFNMSVEADGDYSVDFDTTEDGDKYDEIHKKKESSKLSLEIIYSNGEREEIK